MSNNTVEKLLLLLLLLFIRDSYNGREVRHGPQVAEEGSYDEGADEEETTEEEDVRYRVRDSRHVARIASQGPVVLQAILLTAIKQWQVKYTSTKYIGIQNSNGDCYKTFKRTGTTPFYKRINLLSKR